MPYEPLVGTGIRVYVDWDNDGAFTQPEDDVSADTVLAASTIPGGITAELGRDQGRVTGGPKVNMGTNRLANDDKKYSSAWGGSPYAGQLVPGHLVRYARVHGDPNVLMNDPNVLGDDPNVLMEGQVTAPFFTGRTEEPKEQYERRRAWVELQGFGTIRRLSERTVTIGYQASITTGSALILVLQAAGMVSSQWEIDSAAISAGRTLLHWYVDGEKAWDVCRKLWATEGPPAALYEDKYGILHFEGRQYRTIASHAQIVQQTFSDTSSDYLISELEYTQAYDSVINDMQIELEQIVVGGSPVKVWEYAGGTVVIAASQSRAFEIRTTDVMTAVTAPVVTTDYTLSSGSLSSVTAVLTGPRQALVTFTAGGSGASVAAPAGGTGWQLRATKLTSIGKVGVDGTVDTTSSQALYGKRPPKTEIQSSIWATLTEPEGDSLVDSYLIAYEEPRSVIVITVDAVTFQLLNQALQRRVSDRIHVTDSASGNDLDVSIEQIKHEVSDETQHLVTWYCERIVELDWALYDVGLYNIDFFGQ